MFNGIIYNQGIITKIIKRPKGLNIFVKSNLKVSKKDMGLSVACDGVCLTLISYKSKMMEFYLSKETIIRSKFKFINIKDKINFFWIFLDKSYLFDFELPKKERKHLIEKASICVNGISLTISKVTKKGFQIWIIPHTYKETNLSTLIKSSLVNVEIDILSKYVRNYFNEK
jgi:riboflavin synthase